MVTEYDAAKNSARGYELACSEIRRRGLIAGKYEPRNDDERLLISDAPSRLRELMEGHHSPSGIIRQNSGLSEISN